MRRLEGGVGALALASGQAASAFAIQNVARAGDNVVSSTDLYGGTWNLFANTLKDQGIEVRFVDPVDPNNFRHATDDRTRAYYAETLPNPKLTVFPIAEVAEIGRNFGVPLIMDNTAAPILTRPFEHGAAIIVYSSTKYIGGHGNSIGGLLVDSGTFDWAAHPIRQPTLNTPDPSYHGAVWTEAVKPLGPIAYIIKARVTLLRDLGSPMAPFNAFLTLQGLETLALRIAKHCENTQLVTDYPQEAAGNHAGSFIRRCRPACIASAPRNISRAAWAASSALNSPAARKPAAASSIRWKCSITSPISATPAAWRSIRRRPRILSSRRRSRKPPA